MQTGNLSLIGKNGNYRDRGKFEICTLSKDWIIPLPKKWLNWGKESGFLFRVGCANQYYSWKS